jgi:hypothetical protein
VIVSSSGLSSVRSSSRVPLGALPPYLGQAMAEGVRRGFAGPGGRGGYNPSEPRDWHGRWTAGGGDGAFGSGGRLVRVQYPGIGDNLPPPEGEEIPGEEPFKEAPRVPFGSDQLGGSAHGLIDPTSRRPVLPDGTPWPIATHDQIKAILAPQKGKIPTMVVFVPQDGIGPVLIGSTQTKDFAQPSSYDTVTLYGTPQATYSGGIETGHARDSIDEAIRLARSNQFSAIFFNRSFTTVTDNMVQSLIRPDVIAVARPQFSDPHGYWPREILSPGQTHEERDRVMPTVPFVAPMQSRRYDTKKFP